MIYHVPAKDKWEFDENVTNIFEDMLQRSIPQYDIMRQAIVDLSCAHAIENSKIIDLGCSKGESIALLINKIGGYCSYLGIEVSQPMIDAARERFARYPESLVEIRNLDLRQVFPDIHNASVVISCLTLQFIPIEYRQRIVTDVFKSLLPGGCFVIVEKVLGNSADLDKLFVQLYYDFKSGSGYSTEEIQRKRLSLEGVLVPVTSNWNVELFKQAGFTKIDCFWRWMNFTGWICIK